MTLLFVDGFDTQDTASKWTIVATGGSGPPAFTSSTRLGAGYAMSLPSVFHNPNGFCQAVRPFTASAQVFLGAAVKNGFTGGLNVSPCFHGVYTDGGTSPQLYLIATSSGAVQVWRGDPTQMTNSSFTVVNPAGTLLATSAAGVMDTAWHYVELGATIATSGGTVIVKVDGTTVINFTGNTKNTGTSTNIDAVAFTGMYVYNGPGSIPLGSPTIDDLYVCNALGSVNNSFLGDCRVQTLSPTGAGSSTQFTTTGSANNWANVSEVPDNTATFNASFTTGQRDTYTAAHLAAGTGTVFGVQQSMTAMKTDVGTVNLKAAQKSGATVSYGATRSLGTSFALYTDVFETNPASSLPYTVSDVNAFEIGAEVA